MTDSPTRELERDPLTIGLITHYLFCPRRAWLEAEGEKTDTEQMAFGIAEHLTTDDAHRGRTGIDRGVEVINEALDYVGKCDTIERFQDGTVGVIEYKTTPVRHQAEATEPMKVQVALQVMALESMGKEVSSAEIYFTEHQAHVPVKMDESLRRLAELAVVSTRECLSSPVAPEPLEDDPRCSRCSHISVCLPDERKLAPITRRIVVADPDTQVVHLSTPGSRACIRQGRILVVKGSENLASFPIEKVQTVVVHGNVDLSGGLIRELLWRGLPVLWCSSNGRLVGYASSAASPNGSPRVHQCAASEHGRLDLAREFVSAKIANQATLLRRNGNSADMIQPLRVLSRDASSAHSLEELLGFEGSAGHIYFGSFNTMLKQENMTFTGRSRRPASDPVNAALNYAYTLLLGDCTRAILACGLDPHAGFLHSSNRNKPALALDLCEEFRAPIADSVVIRTVNNRELKPNDFFTRMGTTTLTETGRKHLIAAFEQRMLTTITHPVFRYEVTWRRAIEIQARLILGVLDGTQQRYMGIRVR